MKWNIDPKLLFSTAIYQLEPHQPADSGPRRQPFRPRHPGWRDHGRGFEASLNGYVTDQLAVVARIRLYRRPNRQGSDRVRHDAADRRRQSRSTGAVQSDSPGGTNTSSRQCGAPRSASFISAIPLPPPTIPSGCPASFVSMPRSMPRSTQTGARNSMSKISSTRDIGLPRMATTTSHPGKAAPSA